MKGHRQGLILELVDHEPITSQELLRERLRGRGVETTQATLSRDIRDLGLVKRAADGAYRRPEAAEPAPVGDPDAVLKRAIDEYLRTTEVVQQLVVLKTPTGLAQPLAVAIDSVRLREIAGTIAGDDTILVVCRSAADAASLDRKLGSLRR
jgi:transcriptional regulator of arginine metabolism